MKTKVYCAVALAVLGILHVHAQGAQQDHGCDGQARWSPNLVIVTRDEGWRDDFVDRKRVLVKETPLTSLITSRPEYSEVLELEFAVAQKRFKYPEVMVDPCKRTSSIKDAYMDIRDVYAFKLHGRVFAYQIVGAQVELIDGEWLPCMCSISMMLYDSKGNGKLDELHVNSSELPSIPRG
jgi:hypothetical protein